ncbi:MAG: SUF system NifU family Fe-S cluster assembly protein [Verrucomicrobiae bacterium]|nr:SUF system NifU family Fe-S cluster assembly protein [Verrucomicrobiae bacterium]MCX7721756.1 SUF system NifU family Fe-S cluster assembly protein [Verrucomicrobiae bacterium]MDW7980723.1 SUF system NifU family Fe-S cluster assembly protein [Verrucomicrobiales bacterium]
MSDELTDLYQEVILDHCKRPRNFRELDCASCTARGDNPLCGDQLTLFIQLDGDTIREISFVGSGCCISKATASLLTEALKGKTVAEARALFEKVHTMLTTGAVPESVGKLAVLSGVHKYPARVKCATLAWHTLLAALEGRAEPVTTESDEA